MNGKPLRVLMVEDSEDDAVLVLRELRQAGYETEHLRVETCGEMSAALQGQSWDVILCDYRMPSFTAPEALKLLKDADRNLPFILVSGAVGENTAVEIMKAGAQDYLMKDNLTRLSQAVERGMRDAAVRAERRQAKAALRLSNRLLRIANRHSETIPLLRGYVDEVRKYCGCEAVGIRLLGKDGLIPFAAHEGFSREFLDAENSLRIDVSRCICTKVILDAIDPTRPFYTKAGSFYSNSLSTLRSGLSEAERREICPVCFRFGFESLALIPIRQGNHVLGLIRVADSRKDMVPLDLVGVLHGAAMQLATAIQRVLAQQALNESEEVYRTLVETSPDAILQVDLEGNILRVNRQAAAATGGEGAELVGKNFFALIDTNDRDSLIKSLQKTPAAGSFGNIEVNFLRNDGKSYQGEMNAAVVTDNGGEPNGFIAVMRDVSERKKLQASLVHADRMASVGTLAAGVAHEINNPLAYVQYNLQSLAEDLRRISPVLNCCRPLLARFLQGKNPAEIPGDAWNLLGQGSLDDMVARASEAAEGSARIGAIVRDLKTFTRPEEDHKTPVLLNQAIDSAVNMAHNEIRYRSRLVKQYGDIPPVLATKDRLSQVFLNLLVNAAQAIEEGDIDHNEIAVKTWTDGNHVFAEVADTGRGIPGENFKQLFDPFFTTKPPGVGSGLGLSICHNFVRSYDGRIGVESQVGKGSRFTVVLPVLSKEYEADPSPEPAGETASAQPAVHGRILVVDDEPMIGSTMRRILQREHDVTVVTSGIEGREILEKNQSFDLILCDLMMPDFSGMDLHAWLEERNPELARRMVFVTGGAFTPMANEFLRQVDNLLLEKPFDPGNLKAIVADLLSRAGDGGESTDKE